MDFHSVMETFAEAWVAANTHTPLTVAAEQVLLIELIDLIFLLEARNMIFLGTTFIDVGNQLWYQSYFRTGLLNKLI